MNDTVSSQLKSFKEFAVALAQEDLRYKAEKKSTLTTSLSCVILNCELEYRIADTCYNPNSYDGYTGEEGCEYRYPVCVYQDKKLNKYYGTIKNLKPNEIGTIKYKFGSNHLFIGDGLIQVLEYLEKRYNLDFDKLEQKHKDQYTHKVIDSKE